MIPASLLTKAGKLSVTKLKAASVNTLMGVAKSMGYKVSKSELIEFISKKSGGAIEEEKQRQREKNEFNEIRTMTLQKLKGTLGPLVSEENATAREITRDQLDALQTTASNLEKGDIITLTFGKSLSENKFLLNSEQTKTFTVTERVPFVKNTVIGLEQIGSKTDTDTNTYFILVKSDGPVLQYSDINGELRAFTLIEIKYPARASDFVKPTNDNQELGSRWGGGKLRRNTSSKVK